LYKKLNLVSIWKEKIAQFLKNWNQIKQK